MSRILILGVVVVLLFGGALAADQALQNPALEPGNAPADSEQQQYAEVTGVFYEAAPVALLVLTAGAALAGVRQLGVR